MPFATPFNHYNNKYVYMDFFFSPLLPIYAPMGMLSVELFFSSSLLLHPHRIVRCFRFHPISLRRRRRSLLNYNAFLSNSLYSEVEMNGFFFFAPFASLLPSYSAQQLNGASTNSMPSLYTISPISSQIICISTPHQLIYISHGVALHSIYMDFTVRTERKECVESFFSLFSFFSIVFSPIRSFLIRCDTMSNEGNEMMEKNGVV